MDREQLLELLRLHSQEVHFQVQLNWDRAKSSLAFHSALLALITGIRDDIESWLLLVLFGFISISAALCAVIINTGHNYYRAARDRRREVEAKLNLELGFVTTKGMREPGVTRWVTINRILVLLHAMIALLAFGGAIDQL